MNDLFTSRGHPNGLIMPDCIATKEVNSPWSLDLCFSASFGNSGESWKEYGNEE